MCFVKRKYSVRGLLLSFVLVITFWIIRFESPCLPVR